METEPIKNDTLDIGASTWKYWFTDLADPRTSGWFLMSDPIAVYVMLILYYYFVKKIGPQYMKDKKPYQLNRIIRVYNVLQIAVNAWLFKQAVNMWSNYNWNCQPVDYSNSPDALRDAWVCYLYFLNKLTDFLDTIFFVLRKKYNQITFLHVFHHIAMVWATWHATKFLPGGQGTSIILLNSFVHILLYGYYYLAAFGPKVQKYLWWKKYLTRIQLIQFCMVLLHHLQLLYFDCGYSKLTLIWTIPVSSSFFYLFYDFYKKAYRKVETGKETISSGAEKSIKVE